MPQAIRKNNKEETGIVDTLRIRLREGFFILLLAISIFLLLALVSYHPTDPGWSYTASLQEIENVGGPVGAWFSDIFLYFLGYIAYGVPLAVAYFGWTQFQQRFLREKIKTSSIVLVIHSVGAILVLLAGTGMAGLYWPDLGPKLPVGAGGILGTAVANALSTTFDYAGSILLLCASFLIGITFLTGLSWLRLMGWSARQSWRGIVWLYQTLRETRQKQLKEKEEIAEVVSPKKQKAAVEVLTPVRVIQERVEPKINFVPENLVIEEEEEGEFAPIELKSTDNNFLPSVELLDLPTKRDALTFSEAALQQMSRQVELKLQDFGVDAQVVAVNPGPVITRFELQLAPGIKASKVTNLAKDLARSLLVRSVRIVEVIPGKSVIGLELPNEKQEVVRLREILESEAYRHARSTLTLILGKDIAGFPVVVDLTRMPHLLVAGTTGSGKSVGVNAMLLSLLYKAGPDKVRLLMIDPKMLELSIYAGIPHLLAPVVTDMREAANALRWCVNEMDERYRIMATLGVRNLAGYNKKVQQAAEKGQPIVHPFKLLEENNGKPVYLEPMAYIVVVIDELADMMMVVGKKVDQLIARIAQKARAAGIHLIVSTQRPSVDVITGLIKANIPTRIAFQVSSRIDSRTILDQQGAEHLLGNGDMLYLPAGSGLPMRVHGAFVDDHEVHNVVRAWKKQGNPQYLQEILEGTSNQDPFETSVNGDAFDNGSLDAEQDELYDQAVYMVTQSRRASISHIQRRLKIGYNRAARLIETMEKAGIVSEMENNGSRAVLAPPPPAHERERELE